MRWELILLLDLSKDLEFLWHLEVLIQDIWHAEMNSREKCQVELLVSPLILMEIKLTECHSKQENNISEEIRLLVTFVHLKLYLQTFHHSLVCGMVPKVLNKKLIGLDS